MLNKFKNKYETVAINNERYEKYRLEADKEKNLIIGGRLGNYKYYDMDKTIVNALDVCKKELAGK